MKGHWKLKQETSNRSLWRTHIGGG